MTCLISIRKRLERLLGSLIAVVLVAAVAAVAACAERSGPPQPGPGSSTSSALTGTPFEGADGNLEIDGEGAEDWENAPHLFVAIDKPSGGDDDALGQGAKEDSPDPAVVQGSIPPNKSDLSRFYVATERVGAQDYLFLAWRRTNVLGSANMDFEFNQSRTLSGNGVTAARTAGDILVTFDFVNGGGRPVLGLLTWTTGGPASQCFASNKLPCWGNRVDLSAAGFADGAVNTTTVNDPIDGASLPALTFGEAVIDLTSAGVLDPAVCKSFGSALMKSRSSASFTAELKDFIAPAAVTINNCQPVVVKLKKVDPAGVTLSGAVMQLLSDGKPVPPDGTPLGTTTCTTASTDDPATDGIGTCVFTLDVAQVVTGREVTAPNGYAPAPDQTIEVTPSVEPQTIVLTFVDQPVPGRIEVRKHDDVGNPLAGARFALLRNNAPADAAPGAEDWPALSYCTTNAAGDCAFVDVPLGVYFVVETEAPAGYFLADPAHRPVTIHLGGAPGVGETVTVTYGNPRKFHAIVIVCQTATNALYSSAVSLDGAAPQMSITADQALAAGFGDPSALCRITQAQFGDKRVGNNSGPYSVTIP